MTALDVLFGYFTFFKDRNNDWYITTFIFYPHDYLYYVTTIQYRYRNALCLEILKTIQVCLKNGISQRGMSLSWNLFNNQKHYEDLSEFNKFSHILIIVFLFYFKFHTTVHSYRYCLIRFQRSIVELMTCNLVA